MKCAALRRAADAWVTGAFTANYDGNGPMLAVNNWFDRSYSVLVCNL